MSYVDFFTVSYGHDHDSWLLRHSWKQVTVHVKGKTECYECQPKPAPKTYPVCTITSTPSKVNVLFCQIVKIGFRLEAGKHYWNLCDT